MSYVNRGLGDMDRTAAATKCGTKYGVMSPDFKPCVDHYASGARGEYGSGLFDKFMNTMFPDPAPPTPQPNMTPAQVQAMIAAQKSGDSGMSQNTMIALGLGAVGLLAVVMIASRK